MIDAERRRGTCTARCGSRRPRRPARRPGPAGRDRGLGERQVDDIDYYLVLAKWKLAIVLEQGFQRAGDDVKLQAFGPIVLDLMKGTADLAATSDYR